MTDTDRELLELAAKAAGYWSAEFNCAADLPHLGWNPLTDDGDALRLAVRLRLDVDQCQNLRLTEAWRCGVIAIVEPWGIDPLAATRRAIVRAAAEIGKAMK